MAAAFCGSCLRLKYITWAPRVGLLQLRCASAAKIPERLVEVTITDSPPLRLSFGKLAKFADGNAVAAIGDTSVLTTAVSKNKPGSGGASFVPLTVDYRQKSAAAGRIPTNFLRREMGTSDKEILTSRVIDRSVRPLFPKGFGQDTQLVCNLLSVDADASAPDIVALNAASAALAVSDIPWNGPVGAVRVGCVDSSHIVINPSRKQMARSDLDLIVTGDVHGQVVMLEAEANNLDWVLFLEAVERGLKGCAEIARAIAEAATTVKREMPPPPDIPEGLVRDFELLCLQKVRGIFCDTSHDKVSRDRAIFEVRDDAIAALRIDYPTVVDLSIFHEIFNRLCRNQISQLALEERIRVDGRDFRQLRPVTCETDLHRPLHGSALFQRGQTQVFCTVSLDSLESALKSDPVSVLTGAVKEKNFFLHYEFPPYATNDIGRTVIGRRELGHGALAEKALRSVVPKDYPFTIRLTSEVLESNGSSSMASVCGGTLALLDAGVPLSESAAGVAVGLVTQTDEKSGEIIEHSTLLDILGLEDFLGDMDFKVAGTRTGITALQADIKLPGIPFFIIKDAIELGTVGINHLLDIMDLCRAEPRTDKTNLPVVENLNVPAYKSARLRGPGGMNLRRLTSETGARLIPASNGDDNDWKLFAPNAEALAEAKEMIETLMADEEGVPEFEFGAIITVKVLEIREKTILVEMHPKMAPVLIHVSQLSATKVLTTDALNLKDGDTMQVKYFGRDPETGSIRLSRKALTVASATAVKMLSKSARSHRDDKDAKLDKLLNEVMAASSELEESLLRLSVTEEELLSARKKYLFLRETSYTNRLMAEAFMHSTYEKYQKLLSKKKAVEEVARMNRTRVVKLKYQLEDVKRRKK